MTDIVDVAIWCRTVADQEKPGVAQSALRQAAAEIERLRSSAGVPTTPQSADLRQLAKQLTDLATESGCAPAALPVVLMCADHLCAIAGHGELVERLAAPAPAGVEEDMKAAAVAALISRVEELEAVAEAMSRALLKVRPLGGSELFMKVGDRYLADPGYCGAVIDKLRTDLHEARVKRARP